MVLTILQSDFVVYGILPFLLVFTLIFAVLQKTKILGDGKKQIDAIVSLVIGLIVISFASATDFIVNLVPFLPISLVVILVFMILYGMVFAQGEFRMSFGLQIAFGILAGIALIIAVLVFSGTWDNVLDWFSGGDSSTIWSTVAIVAVIIAVVWIVLGTKSSDSSSKPVKSG